MSPINKASSSAYFTSFFGSVHSLKPLLGIHYNETEMQKNFFCCLCSPQSCKKCFVGNPLHLHSVVLTTNVPHLGSGTCCMEFPSESCRHPCVLLLNLWLFHTVSRNPSYTKPKWFSEETLISLDLKVSSSHIWSHSSVLGSSWGRNEENSNPSDPLEHLLGKVLFLKKAFVFILMTEIWKENQQKEELSGTGPSSEGQESGWKDTLNSEGKTNLPERSWALLCSNEVIIQTSMQLWLFNSHRRLLYSWRNMWLKTLFSIK